MLFLTSAWIVKEGVQRLLSPEVEVETTWYALAVVLIAMAVDFFRARALMRVAKATQSQALEAESTFAASDIAQHPPLNMAPRRHLVFLPGWLW